MTDTFIGPSKPFKLPKRNLVVIAIQKLTLRPKRVLKITLRSATCNFYFITEAQHKGELSRHAFYKRNLFTNTVTVPIIMTGFRP